jgi:hypothetical protein
MFPACLAGDTLVSICAILCYVSMLRAYMQGALEQHKRVSTQSSVPFSGLFVGASIGYEVGVARRNLRHLPIRSVTKVA